RLSLVSGAITTGLGQVVDTNNLLSTTPLETEEFAAPKQKNEPVIVYDDYATASKEFKAAHAARRGGACGISRGRLKKDNLEHVLTPIGEHKFSAPTMEHPHPTGLRDGCSRGWPCGHPHEAQPSPLLDADGTPRTIDFGRNPELKAGGKPRLHC
ncbi:hypothetical protein ACKVWC_003506, partial [Pyricularia oryzae]